MPESTANYLNTSNFKVVISLGGKPVAEGGFREISGLDLEMEAFTWQEGGENRFIRHFRGQGKHSNLVFKRGYMTGDSVFFDWLYDSMNAAGDKNQHVASFAIEAIPGGQTDQPSASWNILNAFVIRWEAPILSLSSGVAVESMEVAYDYLEQKFTEASQS